MLRHCYVGSKGYATTTDTYIAILAPTDYSDTYSKDRI